MITSGRSPLASIRLSFSPAAPLSITSMKLTRTLVRSSRKAENFESPGRPDDSWLR